jgi:hypothetical protein
MPLRKGKIITMQMTERFKDYGLDFNGPPEQPEMSVSFRANVNNLARELEVWGWADEVVQRYMQEDAASWDCQLRSQSMG